MLLQGWGACAAAGVEEPCTSEVLEGLEEYKELRHEGPGAQGHLNRGLQGLVLVTVVFRTG